MTILLVVVILVVLIVVHEFGHFLAAKLFRIRVDEFGIGYPPRALLIAKFGGTEYTLNWIPFGGFVRLFGEEEERGKGSLADAPRWKQALVMVAGVAMNALLAYALFAGALYAGIPHAVAAPQPGEVTQLMVADVVDGSPAQIIGLKPGDTVVSVADGGGANPGELTPDSVADFVAARGGKPVSITYLRAGATSTVQLIPAQAVIADAPEKPAVGIALALVAYRGVSWGEALVDAFPAVQNSFAIVGNGLWSIISDAFRGKADLTGIVGPVGLVQVVGEASRGGLGDILSLAAFISINLVFINLLPIPILDGGRLCLLALEAILRRNLPHLLVQLLNAIGLALIILLMLAVTYRDIIRLLM